MPLYQWLDDSTISQLESITNAPGKVEAILRPKENADPKALLALRQTLGDQGIINYISCNGGCHNIIIPNIRHSDRLLNLLHEAGFTQGIPTVTKTSEDREIAQDSAMETLKKSLLLASASFYNLGNISSILSGYMRAKHNRDGKFTSHDVSELMTGVAFSVGDVLLMMYGKDKTLDPLTAFSQELKIHLDKNGIDLPKGPSVTPDQIHNSNFFHSLHDFLGKHVTSIKCLSEAAGGAFMIKASLKQGQYNPQRLMAGLLIGTGWLTTFMLDKPHAPPYEFKPEVGTAPQSTGGKLAAWLNENPRGRIAAPAGISNNLLNLSGVFWPKSGEAWRFKRETMDARAALTGKTGAALTAAQTELSYHERKQYDWSYNVFTACSFLIAHSLFGMSGEKKTARDVVDTKTFSYEILAVAANMLANIPDNARRLAVEDAATYVSSIKGVNLNVQEAAAIIDHNIDQLRQSPFLRAGLAAR